MNDDVLAIDHLLNGLIVLNVSADLFTVQEPGVRVEFQIEE